MFTKVRRINTHKKFPISILQYNIIYLSRNLNNTFLFLMCLQALMKKTRESESPLSRRTQPRVYTVDPNSEKVETYTGSTYTTP